MKGSHTEDGTMDLDDLIRETVEGRFPELEWEEGCEQTRPHYVAVIEDREGWMNHVEVEVAHRIESLEVNVLDVVDENHADFPYLSSQPPCEDDEELRDQIVSMVEQALRDQGKDDLILNDD